VTQVRGGARARITVVSSVAPPIFYYDFSSPYSYLAAMRVDDVLPVRPEWRPVSFGVIVQRLKRVPWSFAQDRSAHFDDMARRARDRGLPPIRYPVGWPRESYSLIPLRAAMLAADQQQLRTLSCALYSAMFVEGRHLADVETVLQAGERAGMDPAALAEGIELAQTKEQLRLVTEEALERGVTGVPTVAVGASLFWGDDRLQDAGAAAGA
jgi:2-hydroxychromene-2-carboxylate isomerase